MAIDITPPILKSLVFPKVVDISQGTAPFKISAIADGTGSIISGVRLFFDKPLIAIYNFLEYPAQSPLSNFGYYFLDGGWSDDNWNDGQCSQTFGIKPSNENQTLQLLKVVVLDKEGNERTYLIDELVRMGITTDFSVIGSAVDNTPPTISISSTTTTLNELQTATISFLLSESSLNFTLSDVSVYGGTLSNFAGSGTSYTAKFSPSLDASTEGRVTVGSNVFTDAAGNFNSDGFDLNNTITFKKVAAITNEKHTLNIIVDKGILGTSATYLKGLTESITTTNGTITTHTVEYAGTTFDYAKIDALVTTVIRDEEFTPEFRKELTDAAPTTTNLSYKDAIFLVGLANIDSTLLAVAGIDGNFVG